MAGSDRPRPAYRRRPVGLATKGALRGEGCGLRPARAARACGGPRPRRRQESRWPDAQAGVRVDGRSPHHPRALAEVGVDSGKHVRKRMGQGGTSDLQPGGRAGPVAMGPAVFSIGKPVPRSTDDDVAMEDGARTGCGKEVPITLARPRPNEAPSWRQNTVPVDRSDDLNQAADRLMVGGGSNDEVFWVPVEGPTMARGPGAGSVALVLAACPDDRRREGAHTPPPTSTSSSRSRLWTLAASRDRPRSSTTPFSVWNEGVPTS